MTESSAPTVVGRYVLHAPIARGGMATIHLARLHGAEGFSRTVAAKRLHPQFAEDAEFVKMLLDEARIASKIHHPNVVPVLDVVQTGTEVILVEEYVHGVPLDKLLRASAQKQLRLPVEVNLAIMSGVLAGLSAVHDAKDELGQSLEIVHRDVSPQNVIVGVDGVARLLDFGVAKATLNTHLTRAGMFKGKLAYTSPEQLRGVITRLTDVYAASVMLWEALAGRRLHQGLSEAELVAAVSAGTMDWLTDVATRDTVSEAEWQLLERLEPIIHKGMAMAMAERYPSAAELHEAILAVAPVASNNEVAKWVKLLGSEFLEGRQRLIASEESSFRRNRSQVPMPDGPPLEPSIHALSSIRSQVAASITSQLAKSLEASVLPPGPLQLSVPVGPPSKGRVEWAIVAGLLLIGGLLTGILAMMWRKPVEPPLPPIQAAAPAFPPVAPPTETIAVAAASAPPPAPLPTPQASSAATQTADPPPSHPHRSRSAPAPRPSPPPAPVVATPPPAPTVDCSTPFYFDGKKKVFKPGCL